jgi:ribosomal protein S18 acetylase RimI-like enzyme
MLLVPADKQEYHEFIRLLRNDPRVVDGFIQNSYITAEQQKEYMKKYSHCFFVCLINGEFAGYVGVIDDDIRVATHPDYQKRGVGKFMLEQIKNKFPNALAKIKITNEASLKLFESSGFKVKYYLLERE